MILFIPIMTGYLTITFAVLTLGGAIVYWTSEHRRITRDTRLTLEQEKKEKRKVIRNVFIIWLPIFLVIVVVGGGGTWWIIDLFLKIW